MRLSSRATPLPTTCLLVLLTVSPAWAQEPLVAPSDLTGQGAGAPVVLSGLGAQPFCGLEDLEGQRVAPARLEEHGRRLEVVGHPAVLIGFSREVTCEVHKHFHHAGSISCLRVGTFAIK